MANISMKKLLALLALVLAATAAQAATIFSTTFSDANCATWNQSMGLGDATVCQNGDGIEGYGPWTAPNHPNGDEIVAAANFSGGLGGKGFRHWSGNGMNSGGGSLNIYFPSQTEMWVRYYVRHQLGFAWQGGPIYQKQIYVNSGAFSAPGTFYFGLHDSSVGGHVEVMSSVNQITSKTWVSLQGGSTGDGTFHCIEVHAKMNNPGASSNGIMEVWVDGVKVYTNTAVQFSTTTGATWQQFTLSNNENAPSSASNVDQATDFDDIVISNSGYIGTIGGGDVTAPVLSSASAGTATSTGTTGASFSTDEGNGTGYWTTYLDGSPTPSATQVEAHTGTGVQGAGSQGLISVPATGVRTISNITGLSASTAYDIYFVQRDSGGNLSLAIKADLTTAAADVSPPALSSASVGTPTAFGSSGPSYSTNEGNGIGYWTTYTDGATPTATNVKNHDGIGAQVPGGSRGSLPVSTTGTQIVTDLTGLVPLTSYDVWYVQEDAAGNLSAGIKADLTTSANLQTIFFNENCENNNFPARGWYDIVGSAPTVNIVDATTHAPVGTAACKFHFASAATVPTEGYPGRHIFTPSETVYLNYWMKLGTSGVTWQGSGQNYHPHMIRLFTDVDGDFISPNRNSLSITLDVNVFKPDITAFDHLRIYDDPGATYPHNNATPSLLGTNAAHACFGGNGFPATGVSSFYNDGNNANVTYWRPVSNTYVNNTWHHIEAYIGMNSISGDVPQANGFIKYWVDGLLVVNETALELRTFQYATQKFNQIAILPYIGDGSPIAQDFWLDNLVVADQPLGAPTFYLPLRVSEFELFEWEQAANDEVYDRIGDWGLGQPRKVVGWR